MEWARGTDGWRRDERNDPWADREPADTGYVTYGSDSGHQAGGFGGGAGGAGGARGAGGVGAARGAAGPNPANDWALNDEAIKNLGYMQMKKTHDAAMALIDRMYGGQAQVQLLPRLLARRARSTHRRATLSEGLRRRSRKCADRRVSLRSCWRGTCIRIQEKPLDNWVTNAKVNAIRGEFMRQCDKLDGLVDGIINNYMACREIFDVKQGAPNRHPWAAKRCPNNMDPNPADTSANACLTDGQISTLEWVYSRYPCSVLANGAKSFGMWLPNTDVSGGGLIANTRFLGQEGAGANAGK